LHWKDTLPDWYLKKYGKTRGVAGLCIGGGEATAMAVEVMS